MCYNIKLICLSMSKHPVNLAVRFVLEVMALISFGIWAYGITVHWTRFLLVVLVPVIFALLWGVFAVQNDPSRSGKTIIPTQGIVRLILELVLFGSAAWMLFDMDYILTGWIFAVAVLLHYLASYDRILWLLKQK